MPDLHSFDVFDTVLVRSVGSPTGIFLVMHAELERLGLASGTAQEFRRVRMAAEQAASRKSPGSGGPTIAKIYDELAAVMGWSEEQKAAAMLIEHGTEMRHIHSVAAVDERIRSLRAAKQAVVFLSDMYWPAAQIKALLAAHGIDAPGDSIFVSGECGLGKTGGGLFLHALQSYQAAASTMKHHGNSLAADVGGARRAGVFPVYCGAANLSAREEKLLLDQENRFEQFLAGTARRCRLANSTEGRDPHLDALTEIASAVVMPSLMNFAVWVVRQAQSRSLKRLVFVSRDGWLLEKCVRKALRMLGADLNCLYIYGSRQAWHGAAVDLAKLEQCSWLTEGKATLTFGRLLRRLGLTNSPASQYAQELGIQVREDEVLETGKLEQVMGCFRKAAGTKGSICAEMLQKRTAVTGYLRQMGVISNEPTALVDLGWVGRLQDSLNDLVETEGGRRVDGFFLGLVNSAQPARSDREAFLFDLRKAPSLLPANAGFLQVLESFCAQRHGTVVGYVQEKDGLWAPKFATVEDREVVKWGIDHVHKVVLDFLEKLPDDGCIEPEKNEVLIARATRILTDFVRRPTHFEALHWGAFPFEHEQSGGNYLPLARGCPRLMAGLQMAVRATNSSQIGGYWRAGANALTPWPTRLTLDVARKLSSLIRRA